MNGNRFRRSLPGWDRLFAAIKLLDFLWRQIDDPNLSSRTGCLLAFSVAAGIEAGRILGIAVPMPLLLLFAAVVFAANIGGMRGGLASTAAAALYLIYAGTVSADLPGFSREPASVAGSIVLVLAIAIVVGKTRDRNRARIAELERAGRERDGIVQELSAELAKVGEQLLEAIASQNRRSLHEIAAKQDGSPPQENPLDRRGGLTRIKASLESEGGQLSLGEVQMRAIFDSALDAILIADSEGRYIEANPAASQLLGLPHSEILGKRIADFMEPGFDFALAWNAFLEQGQLSGEISLVRTDGEMRVAEYAARANFLPGRHLSVLRDITERKQVELALMQERNLVSAILDTAAALVVVMNSQGQIARFNRTCQEMTGYSLAEVRGKYLWDLFLIPEEVELVQGVFQELLSGRVPRHYENYWLARDGSRRLISWSNAVLLEADGSVKYVIGTGIDISDRATAEQARRALEREQELSQLGLSFFSMASHQFRTPLSSILVAVQSLLYFAAKWPEPKKVRKHRQIESAAQRMNRLIENILTINRAETGKLEFHPAKLNLEQFCLHVVDEIQENTRQENAWQEDAGSDRAITSSIQGQDWKAVMMDERLLYFILANLLSNAMKYSPDGGEVHLALTCQQGQVIFEVRDRGIGIPPQDLPHIFEAFYRGENIGKVAGSGLGLTVVKKCVELHGGTIAATSTLGAGSTFVVTLPLS